MPPRSFKFWNISKGVPSLLDDSQTLEKGSFLEAGQRLLYQRVKTFPTCW